MVLLVLALLFSLLIQIGTNFSNDYFDDLRGADRNEPLVRPDSFLRERYRGKP